MLRRPGRRPFAGGDRLLVARALFTLEEQRGAAGLRVAAGGGSLRDRVRRLVVPRSAEAWPAESGWAGAGLIAMAVGFIAMTWLPGTTRARDDTPAAGKTSVRGPRARRGGPAGRRRPGAALPSRWPLGTPSSDDRANDRRGRRVVRAQDRAHVAPAGPVAGPAALRRAGRPPRQGGGLADHLRVQAAAFEGDVTLTLADRSDDHGLATRDDRRVPGVKVAAYSLGELSSPSPLFRDLMEELRPDDGPLTAMTDARRRATLRQLPCTDAFLRRARSRASPRATPSASGTQSALTPSAVRSFRDLDLDPRLRRPLAGVKIVLFTDFICPFEHAVTDEQGSAPVFTGLRATRLGYEPPGVLTPSRGHSTCKLWTESDRCAIPTHVRHAGSGRRMGASSTSRHEKAGVIRVTVSEEGTDKPVAGVPASGGFDQATGSSGRFNACTDETRPGDFLFHAGKDQSIAGPPDGYYHQWRTLAELGPSTSFRSPAD